jgi:hypothetical protein
LNFIENELSNWYLLKTGLEPNPWMLFFKKRIMISWWIGITLLEEQSLQVWPFILSKLLHLIGCT